MQEETLQASFFLSLSLRCGCLQPKGEISPATDPAGILILDYQSRELQEKYSCCLSYLGCGFSYFTVVFAS